MSDVTVINMDNVPAFARGKSALSEALDVTLNGGFKRLSIKGGTFRYIAGGQEIGKIKDRFLDVVLVNAARWVSRTWYASAYVEGDKMVAPACWSADGVTPDAHSSDVQSANCASCKQNVKGSGQGDSKACRYSQRLAVVLANDIGGQVLQLSLPSASIFGEASAEAGASLQGYYKGLSARSLDPSALVTRLQFDTDVATPKIGFTARSWLSQDQYDVAVAQGKSDDAVRAITMSVSDESGAAPPLALPAGKAPVMQAPAKVAAPVKADKKAVESVAAPAPKEYATAPPEETASEPVVRKTADAAVPANPKLAALMAGWGADDE